MGSIFLVRERTRDLLRARLRVLMGRGGISNSSDRGRTVYTADHRKPKRPLKCPWASLRRGLVVGSPRIPQLGRHPFPSLKWGDDCRGDKSMSTGKGSGKGNWTKICPFADDKPLPYFPVVPLVGGDSRVLRRLAEPSVWSKAASIVTVKVLRQAATHLPAFPFIDTNVFVFQS